MLIDEVMVTVRAGYGGDGAVSFRREKYVAKGGPDGGDGGNGGNVAFMTSHSTHGLANFRGQNDYKAEDGARGGRNKRHGGDGQDLVIAVPLGTKITEIGPDKSERLLIDLVDESQSMLMARGGRGGKGNWHFRGPTNQTPRHYEPGLPGQMLTLKLELQLLADVGLIGLPNAGKSTLLSAISNARPKIADYPFTTLQPHLGVVVHRREQFVVADIPGLIEGAAIGKGLGIEFLKHIERTKVLVHLIAATDANPERTYDIVRQELKSFDVKMLDKPELVVLSQIDLVPEWKKAHVGFIKKHKVMGLSATTHLGLRTLLDAMRAELD